MLTTLVSILEAVVAVFLGLVTFGMFLFFLICCAADVRRGVPQLYGWAVSCVHWLARRVLGLPEPPKASKPAPVEPSMVQILASQPFYLVAATFPEVGRAFDQALGRPEPKPQPQLQKPEGTLGSGTQRKLPKVMDGGWILLPDDSQEMPWLRDLLWDGRDKP